MADREGTSETVLARLGRWLRTLLGLAPPYPGDFTGRLVPEYSPKADGRPDPGEVVWTWVPFAEDHRQGKDRPVLLVGRDGRWLLGLQLTSRSHRGHPGNAGPRGPRWVDVGVGGWDPQRRPSEVRVDRVVRVDPRRVRREGAVLPRERFDAVAAAVARRHR
ncbi:type II toxin-antitoxin system PemK/MazF family toxin [Phycicoccus flavus]|uniref:Type II toxin-antitoxin system PemK/MazF family toxin n=1 Tax=Phycicoccus flavus TaxID=2502783 RepID=A0A8T6R1S6_9MICO|nr:type II toxin-antitoxin system PemK/MazF family toxin [Phycicoccus flavus]NHA67836.1 type II toxin-antitoxin system PemK/MazF family toxin [Phycicoccus flavus]